MNSLNLWKNTNPFSDLDSMLEAFYKNDLPTGSGPLMKKALTAKCEISETPQSYLLKFDVPGLKKEDIKIDLHDNRLTVSGERREEKKEDNKKVHYSEVSYGSFMRTYTFPAPVDAEKVEASYQDGILAVNVTKNSTAKGRQVTIK